MNESPDFIGLLKSNQQILTAKLAASEAQSHPVAKGDNSEAAWTELLRAFLPKRYGVSGGFVYDSNGAVSHQIDILLFDNVFSPRFSAEENKVLLPAESVLAAIEVKPSADARTFAYAGRKAESVRGLFRASGEHGTLEGLAPPRKFSPILCGLVASRTSWASASRVQNLHAQQDKRDTKERLDFYCGADTGGFWWEKQTHAPTPYSLSAFLFRLFQALQTIGNVPALDTAQYLAMIAERSPSTPA